MIILLCGDSPEIEWAASITPAELSMLAYGDAPTRHRKLTELGFDDRRLLDREQLSPLGMRLRLGH